MRFVVWSARLVGLVTVVSTVLPGPRRSLGGELRSSLALPPAVGLAGVVVTLVAGVGLLLLATGLRRRKRRAWAVATAFAATLAVVDTAHGLALGRAGHGYVAGVSAAVLFAALVATRHHFVARPDPRGLLRALALLLQLAAAGFALVWLLMALDGPRITNDPGPGMLAAHAALSLVGVEGGVVFRVAWLDDLTAAVGLTFGIVAVLAAGYHLLRSPEPRPAQSVDDTARLRALLARDGADSLGYFALRPDKAVVFAPAGDEIGRAHV